MKIGQRGLRNHNPMNLIHVSSNKFQGLDTPPSDGRFCRFVSPIYGIRAGALVLIAYQDRHHKNTVRELIERYAPYTENDTGAYVEDVAHRMGVNADDPLDLNSHGHLRPLVEAIIRHENGKQLYSDAEIDKALSLAGVEPDMPSLRKSRTVRGGQVVGGLGAAATVTGVLAEIEPAMPMVRFAFDLFYKNFGVALIVFGALALTGIG